MATKDLTDAELVLTFLQYFHRSDTKALPDVEKTLLVKNIFSILKTEKGWRERLLGALTSQYPNNDFEVVGYDG